MKKILVPIIACAAFLLCWAPAASADVTALAKGNEGRTMTVRVGIYDNPPKIYLEKGTVKGIWADIVNEIAKQEKWNVEYVYGTWTECLERLENGEIDILVDVADTEERRQTYLFTDEAILTSWAEVFSCSGLQMTTLVNLDGMDIAVMENSVHTESIQKLMESFGYQVNYTYVDSYARAFELLDKKEVDAAVVNRMYGISEMGEYDIVRTGIVFNPSEVKFAMGKNNPEAENLKTTLDYHVHRLKETPESAYYKSLERHLKEISESIEVTPLWVPLTAGAGGFLIVLAILTGFFMRHYQKKLEKRIEERVGDLRFSEKKYRQIFDSSPEAIIILDRKGTFLDINKKVTEWLGYDREEIIGKNITQVPFMPKASRTQAAKNIVLVLRGKEIKPNVSEFLTKDSQKIYGQYTATMMRDEAGKSIGILGMITNITERVEAERKVKELDDLRNRFIQVVSHQLRTPLNSIRWNLETLLSEDLGALKKDQSKFIEITYGANVRVINTINDMVTAMDIQEGRITLKKEKCRVENIWKSIIQEMEKQHKIKRITSVYNAPESPLPELSIDKEKIRQVFSKLACNAMHYSEEGGVVTSRFKKIGGYVRFEIQDTGIGIPEDEQDRVFTRFYRGSNAISKDPNASGLSLSIAKYFVEQHGGNIGFESEENKGSTFWFELPID
ncbi:MAG: PAS domain S-box protein [Candidatus Kerfeldbacteria bacterium]